MEIQINLNRAIQNIESPKDDKINHAHPNFKGIGAVPLNVAGGFTQWIENGGFLLSFIVQDTLGMTFPRTYAGFLRDKEETGKYNLQEGFEVLGREGSSGPCMMAVAPVMLFLAAKFGKSTSVNSQLIKRFGNSLKEIVSNKAFDRSILKDKLRFKEEFYRTNIKNILEQSLGKENVHDKEVEYILKQLQNYENIPEGIKLPKIRGKAKYRSHCLNNINKCIDKIRYNTSSDLDMLEKVKFGSEISKDFKVFDTKNTFEAMIKYSDDAIIANKRVEHLDEVMAESIKNKALGKRILTTVSTIFATLGVLSVLPKLYARSNVAPGARKNTTQNNNDEKSDITFKGKSSPKSFLEKLGKLLDKNKNDFVSSELEYNGHNFTNTLMAGLSIFGLITPRVLRAKNRAQKDEKTGKKDYTEVWEILIRDISSSLAVVFAVPMITRALVTSYENKTGYVLMQKDRSKSTWKTALDLLNPYSKAHVLTNSEIKSLYGNIDTQEKMLNFCKYIDKNGGDLEKIISKSENVQNVFNSETLDLNSLKGKTKSEKNKEIISFVENIETHSKKLNKKSTVNKEQINSIVKKLMRGVEPGKNKITKLARGWNSIPTFIATVFISPYLLGWFIPRLTYKNTRRIHAKEDKEQEQKLKTTA